MWPDDNDTDELHPFHHHLNQLYPSIQFTIEMETDGKLPFLDVLVRREESHLSMSVYPKPMQTDQCIPFSSHHHPRTLTGLIRGMRDRAHHTSDATKRQAELLEGVFQAKGFPKALVRKTLSSAPSSTEPQPPEEQLKPPFCVLPYIQGLSE